MAFLRTRMQAVEIDDATAAKGACFTIVGAVRWSSSLIWLGWRPEHPGIASKPPAISLKEPAILDDFGRLETNWRMIRFKRRPCTRSRTSIFSRVC